MVRWNISYFTTQWQSEKGRGIEELKPPYQSHKKVREKEENKKKRKYRKNVNPCLCTLVG